MPSSRESSFKAAMTEMRKALDEAAAAALKLEENSKRKAQIGSGLRASAKRRTFRFQENIAIDHLTGKVAPARDVMRGRLDLLW